MLQTIPKTGATRQVEPEGGASEPQKNVGLIRAPKGVIKLFKPKEFISQPSSQTTTLSTTGDLQKDLPVSPKGKISKRRLIKKSSTPMDTSTSTSPSGSSQQAPEESQRENPQAAAPQTSELRGSSEDASMPAQHTLESVSAQALNSQTSDTSLPRTSDTASVSALTVEVPHSTAHDIATTDGSVAIEAIPLRAVPVNEELTETGTGSGSFESDQGISDQIDMDSMEIWNDDEPSQLDDNLVENFEFDEDIFGDLPADHSHPNDVNEQQDVDMPPPPPTQQQQQPLNFQQIPLPQGPYQPPPNPSHKRPIFPENQRPSFVFSTQFSPSLDLSESYRQQWAVKIPAGTTPITPSPQHQITQQQTSTSAPSSQTPPEATDDLFTKNLETLHTSPLTGTTTEALDVESSRAQTHSSVQDLIKKVEDLNKALLDNTRTLSTLQRGKEDQVSSKLNELVTASNGIASAIKEAFQLVKTNVQSNLTDVLSSSLDKLQKDVQKVESEIEKLVGRPVMNEDSLGSSITKSVITSLKEELMKELSDTIIAKVSTEVSSQIKSVVTEITQHTSKAVDLAFTNVNQKVDSLAELIKEQKLQMTTLANQLEKPAEAPTPTSVTLSGNDAKLLTDIKGVQDGQNNEIYRLARTIRLLATAIKKCGELKDLSQLVNIPTDQSGDIDWALVDAYAAASKGEDEEMSKKARSEGELVKTKSGTDASASKGKEKVVEVEEPVGSDKVDTEGFPVTKPAAGYEKLVELQQIVGCQQAQVQELRARERQHHLESGTLDIIDAQSLKLTVDQFKAVKSDPRIQKALKNVEELEINRKYTEENKELDSLTFNKPVSQLVKERLDAQAATKKIINEAVRQVMKELEDKKRMPPVKTRMVKKTTRDKDISQFQPMESDPVRKERELKAARDQYNFFVKHRSNPATIVDVNITGKNNLDLYSMVVTRTDNISDQLSDISVHHFGLTEHKEMVPILKSKQKSLLIQSWLMSVQKKMTTKRSLEVKLGILPTSPTSPPNEPVKRKATDEATDSRPSKK